MDLQVDLIMWKVYIKKEYSDKTRDFFPYRPIDPHQRVNSSLLRFLCERPAQRDLTVVLHTAAPGWPLLDYIINGSSLGGGSSNGNPLFTHTPSCGIIISSDTAEEKKNTYNISSRWKGE